MFPFSIIYQSGYLIICFIYLCTVCMVCFGAVVFTAPSFDALQKEAKESLEFHIEGLMENGEDVPEWLNNGDYEFVYNFIR